MVEDLMNFVNHNLGYCIKNNNIEAIKEMAENSDFVSIVDQWMP